VVLYNHNIGDKLNAYAGGGDYGYCFKCKRTGGLTVTEVPKPKAKTPVGWYGVPGGKR
jgi:hypothetical protein